jgi:methylated-DNA-[protein]-cysteine S-methyltransferase
MLDENAFEKKIASWIGDETAQQEKDALLIALDMLYTAGPDVERSMQAVEQLKMKWEGIRSKVLYYGVMEKSPVGSIFIAVGDRGVVAIDIDVKEEAFVSRIRNKFKAIVIPSPERVEGVIKQLQEYFEGKRSSFRLNLYLNDLTHFQKRVLKATLDIPRGQITTYGEMARRLGKAQWARAVGQALARNPIPIVIPCHRVLAADGSLHGYSGGRGIETKAKLLQLEGALQV